MSRLLLNITLDPGSDSWQATDAIQAALTRQPGVRRRSSAERAAIRRRRSHPGGQRRRRPGEVRT